MNTEFEFSRGGRAPMPPAGSKAFAAALIRACIDALGGLLNVVQEKRENVTGAMAPGEFPMGINFQRSAEAPGCPIGDGVETAVLAGGRRRGFVQFINA